MPINLEISASVGFIHKEFFMMHGHMILTNNCIYSNCSFLMHYTMKYIKFVITKQIYFRTEMCMKSVVWLILAAVACYLNCLDTVVLALLFRSFATHTICFSVLVCWTHKTPSIPSSSIVSSQL
jgi:hypothetical protein